MEKRFYYTRSSIYGWAVYDRQIQQPAFTACAELLPPVSNTNSGRTTVDPCCLTEYKAMELCRKLNHAHDEDSIIEEALVWAKDAEEIADRAKAIEWAIDQHKFNATDEDMLPEEVKYARHAAIVLTRIQKREGIA